MYIMKLNYRIYEQHSGKMPEPDTKIAEKVILAQVKQSCEQPQRTVIRPIISVWKDVVLLTSVIAAVISALIIIRVFTDISTFLFVLICILCGAVYLTLFAKKLLLTVIILYQKYAPEIMRASCLFETCCSEYMKIAVNKYGVCKGFVKGIKRISRCRYPNGGVDEP